MPTALIQIYRFKPEPYLLRTIALGFRRRGWNVVFWSNITQGVDGVKMLPLVLTADDAKLYRTGESDSINWWPKLALWEEFSRQLVANYREISVANDPRQVAHYSRRILDHVRPSLFLCWDGMEPIYGIGADIARERGIPTYIWEAGMLDDSILVDPNGIGPDHSLAKVTCMDATPEALSVGARYMDLIRSRHWAESKFKLARALPSGLPRVLVLGGMDIANGVHRPADGRSQAMPGFFDGVDLARQVGRAHKGSTVYRPHPREPSAPLDRIRSDAVLLDGHSLLEAQLQWADVIVGYGSKTDFQALAIGKPLILVSEGILRRKGICYEALTSEALPQAIHAAWMFGQTDAQRKNLAVLFGHMATNGHFNRSATGPCTQGVSEMVDMLIGGQENTVSALTRIDCNIGPLLSSEGREKLIVEARCWRTTQIALRRAHGMEYLNALPAEKVEVVILDFDLTLFLGNSTTEYLRPIIAYFPWLRAARFLSRRLRKRLLLSTDLVALWLSLVLAPWNYLIWRRNAAEIGCRLFNQQLWSMVESKSPSRVLVVSAGNKFIVKPLLHAMAKYTGGSELELIASGMLPSQDHRVSGKLLSIKKRYPDIKWAKALVVTDSIDDEDLLSVAKHGVLTRWGEPVPPPFKRKTYFPLRYLAEGKYSSASYVWRHVLGQELLIVLAVFTSDLSTFFAAVCYFFSFQIIYELGNYDNDFVAAKLERNPILSGKQKHFQDYRIRNWAWPSSIALGAIATYFNGTSWNAFTANLAIWLAMLVGVYMLFSKYNRSPPTSRMSYYGLMQLAKIFAPAIAMPIVPLGGILGMAHVIQHSTVYWCYRCFGWKELFPRRIVRGVLFFGGTLVALSQNWLGGMNMAHILLLLSFAALLTLGPVVISRVISSMKRF